MVNLQRLLPLIDRLARTALISTAVNMKERRVVSIILLLVLYTAFVVFTEADAQTTISSLQENNEEVEQPVEGEEPDETEAEEEEQQQQTKPELVTLSAGALLTESTVKQSKESIGTTTEAVVTTIYRLNDTNGNACILLRAESSITFIYKTKSGSDRDSSEYVPEDAKITGNCKEEDNAVMSLSWETFTFTWNFAKTPGGERWYVDKAELRFTTNDKMFQNINKPGYKHLKTKENMLFPTPVGKSYSCPSETKVELHNGDITAKVFFRGFKLQPFIFKREFGPEYICSPGGVRAYRDETAPIAVGSTLAIVVLLTVTGYGVYRYFKIKKVQYDTME